VKQIGFLRAALNFYIHSDLSLVLKTDILKFSKGGKENDPGFTANISKGNNPNK
jgi:hypothetical protein